MAKTRIGLVGYGTMGTVHARYLVGGEVLDGELTAVADANEANLARAKDSPGDAAAYVEYESGATGTFITSTGEAPGSNRLEVVGDDGKVVMENEELTFWRLRTGELFGAFAFWVLGLFRISSFVLRISA